MSRSVPTLAGQKLATPPGFPERGQDSAARRYLTSLIDGTEPLPRCLGALFLPVPSTSTWCYGRISAQLFLDDLLTLTPGVIFGGYITCLVDHFASLVMLTVVPDNALVLTAATDTAFHAPLTPGGVTVEAVVTKLSARRALAEVAFDQGQGIGSRGIAEQIIKREAPSARTPGSPRPGTRAD